MKLFKIFKDTGNSWWNNIKSLFSSSTTFDNIFENLEEMLILGDVGLETTNMLINKLKDFSKKECSCTNEKIYDKLIDEIKNILKFIDSQNDCLICRENEMHVIVVSGVNGVGKTTSIAKLANMYKKNYGKSVIVGAGDTFRAAAVEQLQSWCDKINVQIIKGEEGTHPSTIVYKTLEYAKNNRIDLAIIDTAGRLQNKLNLMEELKKMNKQIEKFVKDKENVDHWLVIDGTMGQNVFTQVEEFRKTHSITGLIVTKVDSIAKSGFIIGIADKYKIPIKYVGTGEKIDDIKQFNVNDFIKCLMNDSIEIVDYTNKRQKISSENID